MKDEKIDVKIGTKEESFWTKTKEKIKEEILSCERTIEMDKVLMEFAEKKIAEEK